MNSIFQKQIIIEYPDYLGDSLGTNITKNIEKEGFSIGYIKRDEHFFAAFEWTIPTLIAIYFTKPFFDEIFKEGAKSLISLLKKSKKQNKTNTEKWLFEEIQKAIKVETKAVAADMSPQKLNRRNTQSMSISILVQLRNDCSLKFLFDKNIDKLDLDDCLTNFFSIIHEHYLNFPNDALMRTLDNLSKHSSLQREFYSIFHLKRKEWMYFDLFKIGQQTHYDSIKSKLEDTVLMIEKNKLEEAIVYLNSFDDFIDYRDILSLLKSRLYRINEQNIKGIITIDEDRLEKNRISNSLLELISQIDSNLMKKFNQDE
jgi:Effector-associated domain 11